MVPHATTGLERRRSSSAHPKPSTFKFPDFSNEHSQHQHHAYVEEDISRGATPAPLPTGLPQGLHSSERWPARKSQEWSLSANGSAGTKGRHGRQKSLSEAIRTVRTRKASISENAHEIAESLKAPVSARLITLCSVWYATSILTNTSSKAILTALPRPVTLTIVQFLLVSFWCVFLAWLAKRHKFLRDLAPVLRNGIRKPNKDIILATLPLTAFQIGGHILNSDAMSRIPVSLVHTIKGLSPLMTVFAYRAFLDIRYSIPIYLSLIPLTVGVVMACSASFAGNIIGLLYAFGSAILFVTQNIVSKKIFNEAAKAEQDGTVPLSRRKPDKLNLLCYSSALAVLFTAPIWLFSEGWSLAQDYFQDSSITLRERPGSLDHGALALEFLFNGTFHFGQSLVAFVLLGLVSPVTYSVASLIKRVVVIMFAIVWFGNPMTTVQGAGFALTFLGLYLYDRTSDAAKADRQAQQLGESTQSLLPLNISDTKKNDPTPLSTFMQSPMNAEDLGRPFPGTMGKVLTGTSGYANADPSGSGPGRPLRGSRASPGATQANVAPFSLPPGTKAEETWEVGDKAQQQPQALGVRR